ncbi:MAG: hypothetical protein ACREBR_01340 [bacterium]
MFHTDVGSRISRIEEYTPATVSIIHEQATQALPKSLLTNYMFASFQNTASLYFLIRWRQVKQQRVIGTTPLTVRVAIVAALIPCDDCWLKRRSRCFGFRNITETAFVGVFNAIVTVSFIVLIRCSSTSAVHAFVADAAPANVQQ